MTVLAWYGIPSDCTSVERFEELKNAGFTHQFTEYPDAEAMAARWIRPSGSAFG